MDMLRYLQGSYEIVDDNYTTDGAGGVTLTLSRFDGYSPMLDGSVRCILVDDATEIKVKVKVTGSSASLKDNIRVQQHGNEFAIDTGGLSFLASLKARLDIDILIGLPSTCGNIEITSPELPIIVQSAGKLGDVVLTSRSGSISVASMEAKSLTIINQSGSITVEPASELRIDEFVKCTNQSGSAKANSTILTPSVMVQTRSGTIDLHVATTAASLTLDNTSGSITADIDYMDTDNVVSKVTDVSGSIRVSARRWSGYMTLSSGSGSKSVNGDGVVQDGPGWRKGTGQCRSDFSTRSGSIRVTLV